jgi:Lipase (class 3)
MNTPLFLYTVFILIHGTWGANGLWYQPGGDFFSQFEMCAAQANAMAVPFRWSGDNTDKARRDAAHNLTRLIQSYPANIRICIVAHSHGGNVALLASQFCAFDTTLHKRIDAVYLLGTPAGNSTYKPDMRVINYLYNIISFEDMVQPVIGFFGREQPVHEHSANIRVTIDGKEPDHFELRGVVMGKWLVHLDQMFCAQIHEDNAHYFFEKPGVIHLSTHKKPIYEVDADWQMRIERDKHFNTLVLNSLSRSHTIEKNQKTIF